MAAARINQRERCARTMGKTSHEQPLRLMFSQIGRISGQIMACGVIEIVCSDHGVYNLARNRGPSGECRMNISRRTSLVGLGAAATAAVTKPRLAQAARDGTDPAVIDRMHRKLVYALDDRPVFWWKQGTKYGVIDGEVTPLWNMQVFFVQQARAHRATEFDVASLEVVFLTDLDSGALLDTWRNPYTGETVPVPNRIFGPEAQTLTSTGGEVDSDMPGISIRRRHSFGPANIVGDDVWLREHLAADHHQSRLRRLAPDLRRRQDDHRHARPPHSSLRHRRDRQHQLAIQKP